MLSTHYVESFLSAERKNPVYWRAYCPGEQVLHFLDYEDARTRALLLAERRPEATVTLELSFDQRSWTKVAVIPRPRGVALAKGATA